MLEKKIRRRRAALLGPLTLVLASATLLAEPSSVSQTAARQYKAAESLVIDGRHQAALRLVHEVVADYPHSGAYVEGHFTEPYYPHFLLGWIHMELGDAERALAEFDLELSNDAIRGDPVRLRELTLRRELVLCRLDNTHTHS